MNALVTKILAVGLTLSQLFTTPPEQFRTSFDEQADQELVANLLHEGCAYVTREFKAEDINFELLLEMLVSNTKALKQRAAGGDAEDDGDSTSMGAAAGRKSFTDKLMDQLDPESLLASYRQFCKKEKIENSPLKLNEVIAFYNNAMKDLPDHTKLKDLRLPEASLILDRQGNRFSEIYTDNNRRNWVPLSSLPTYVRQAFVAAEDKRFYQHPGVDVRGIIRAFTSSMNVVRPPARRLHHHSAGGEKPPGGRRPHLRTQDARDGPGDQGREAALQGPNTGTLPELCLSRAHVVGSRNGGQELFRQEFPGPLARPGRIAGGVDQGSELLPPGALPGARPRTPPVRA
ncbi:MAG: hypothetical protein HC902_09900 [Calothrix sp. SM1_5_4]|nr:hypothetical protein [Calothrix sp. SM1_5_4]